MKDVELRLIAELMRDGRKSDRDLAKKLGVSLPTVFRLRAKLKEEGYIKEYTIIPDFQKLGFQLVSFTLAKLKEHHEEEEISTARNTLREMLKPENVTTLLCMRGFGADTDFITIAYHKDYRAYVEFVNLIKQQPLLDVEATRTFTSSLSQTHFHPLSLQTLAEYIAKMRTDDNPAQQPHEKTIHKPQREAKSSKS